MKNKIVFLVTLILLLVSIFFTVYLYTSLNNKIDDKESEIKQLEKRYADTNKQLEKTDRELQRFSKKETETLVNLKASEIKDLIEDKETFAIVISQAGCSHCKDYVPIFEAALKETGESGYIIDIQDLNDSEVQTVKKYFSYSGTPTTY